MERQTKFFLSAHALIVKDGQYLISQRSATDNYCPSLYDLPGGTLKAGETIEQTLFREVKEETGLVIEIIKLLSLYSNMDSYPKLQVFQSVYLCRYQSGKVTLNPSEHQLFNWFAKAEIADLPLMNYIKDLLSKQEFINL
jgi:8-oxo-dGTP diphosphatase